MTIDVHSYLLIRGRASIIAIRETTRDLRERILDFTRSEPLGLGVSSNHISSIRP